MKMEPAFFISFIIFSGFLISICKSKYKDKAIILSSIDNLIKGGAGQAIQNMNILKNFDINEGLR